MHTVLLLSVTDNTVECLCHIAVLVRCKLCGFLPSTSWLCTFLCLGTKTAILCVGFAKYHLHFFFNILQVCKSTFFQKLGCRVIQNQVLLNLWNINATSFLFLYLIFQVRIWHWYQQEWNAIVNSFFLCSDVSENYIMLEISVTLKIQNGCSLIWAISVNCMSEFVVLFVAMQTIVHSWHNVPVEAVVI